MIEVMHLWHLCTTKWNKKIPLRAIFSVCNPRFLEFLRQWNCQNFISSIQFSLLCLLKLVYILDISLHNRGPFNMGAVCTFAFCTHAFQSCGCYHPHFYCKFSYYKIHFLKIWLNQKVLPKRKWIKTPTLSNIYRGPCTETQYSFPHTEIAFIQFNLSFKVSKFIRKSWIK